MTTETEKLACMSGHADGAKWGVSDWYEEIKQGIEEALKKGPAYNWTTGWYSSKKEIASARITHQDGTITVEASVSDDFDTEGRGEVSIPHTNDISKVEEAANLAHDRAADDKKDNEVFVGFSILTMRDTYAVYIGGVGQGDPVQTLSWVETLVRPMGTGNYMDQPPGDNYHKWGWQDDFDIPADVRERLEAWAEEWTIEKHGDYYDGTDEYNYGGFIIRPWKDD